MRRKTIPLLVVVLFLCHAVAAEASIGEKVVGTTIKTVVKLYVATINLEKAKKRMTNKLGNMQDDDYRRRYAKLYELIKDLPEDVTTRYYITRQMTKQQMIRNIQSVNKKEIYRTVNRIPDSTVTALFKQYLREMGCRQK